MPLRVERIKNPDGSPGLAYFQDPLDPDKPVVCGANVQGPITLADGTVYDMSPDWVEADSHDHGGELNHRIGLLHETEGHPLHNEAVPFVHLCTEHCGEFADDKKLTEWKRAAVAHYATLVGGVI